MNRKDHEAICGGILKLSPYVRFVGIVGSDGDLKAYSRRPEIKPLLDARSTKYQFSHIAIKTGLEGSFDKSLGRVEFVWEEREKVQIISFAIKKIRVWISIDKKVIRSEVLRIIDGCLPIVKRHSGA